MVYDEIISKVAEENHLTKSFVDKTYRAYWKVIRQYIISLPLKEDLTDEEFLQLRPNINIPSIGKLYITLERYHGMKRSYERLNEWKKNKLNSNAENQEN